MNIYIYILLLKGLPECNIIFSETCGEQNEDIEELKYCISDIYIYSYENSESCISKFKLDYDINFLKIDGQNIEQLSFGSLSDEVNDEDISKLVFLQKYYDENLEKQIIEKRNGIFMDKNYNYYYIYKNDDYDNIKVNISETSCLNNIGGLSKIKINNNNEIVLCLSETKYMALPSSKDDLSNNLLKGEDKATYSENSPFTIDEDYSLLRVLSFGINSIIDIYFKCN